MNLRQLLLILSIVISLAAWAIDKGSPRLSIDSTLKQVDSARFVKSNEFYDQLASKTKKSDLAALLFKSIFVGKEWRNKGAESSQLIEEIDYYKKFEGKRIRDILIFRSNIINHGDSAKNPIEKWHVLTKQYIVKRNLFFKSGDLIDPSSIVRNQQFLRALKFISDAYILVQPVDSQLVDMIVYTRDNLSLAPGFTSLGSKRYYTFGAESNMLGTGNKFEAGVILSPLSPLYRGYKTEYLFQNIASSFFNLDLLAYKDLFVEDYHATVSKDFLLPTDMAGAATVEQRLSAEYQHLKDSTINLKVKNLEVWLGKSWQMSPLLGSFYTTALWNDCRFSTRWGVTPDFNVNYQNYQRLLFSAGWYKENFYRGSLIYGFGRSEDIPYGFRFETIGGRSWEEFRNRWYAAVKAQFANITHFGYTNSKIELGSFFSSEGGRQEQSVLALESSYFTRLMPMHEWAFRCFFTSKYMHGFNRLDGEGEQLYFNSATAPRSISDIRSAGLNRLVLSHETVAFSPLYLYNFRFAFYGFTDWAWLGNNSNVFKNDQFGSIGFGLRIKNERLIFQTIQLRIGFALKNPSYAPTNWLDVAEEARMRSERLIPSKAAVVDYR